MHSLTQLPPEVRTNLLSYVHKYIDRQVKENHENTIFHKGAAEALLSLLDSSEELGQILG